MKKLLVLVAFAFLACNEGASVPSKDKKAAKAVTSQAFDLLGSDAATVDKALTDAGYVELKESNMNGVVARALKKVRKGIKAESSAQVVYIYNLPQDYEKMTQEESVKYIKDLMDKGECLYVVVVRYSNNKMNMLSTRVIAPLKDNINLLFTEVSDEEYKKMPGSLRVGLFFFFFFFFFDFFKRIFLGYLRGGFGFFVFFLFCGFLFFFRLLT